MATWAVRVRQTSNGQWLNDFDLSVQADHKEDAKVAALAQMEALSEGLQTNHVQDNPMANAQRRPYRKLGWKGARTTIISIKRVPGT